MADGPNPNGPNPNGTFAEALEEIVDGSRRIGADPSLVLHGGGNTSIKATATDVWGEPVDAIYVKGSGWDLATIEPAGFAPLRLDGVRRLAELDELSDVEMMNQLRIHLLDSAAPNPSVETILHALIGQRSVLHSHADAVVALTNTPDGADVARSVWGDTAVIVPYVMPGFDLAHACAAAYAQQRGDDTNLMVLLNHGIFTYANDTQTAYDVMAEAIEAAHEHLARHANGAARSRAPQHPEPLSSQPTPSASHSTDVAVAVAQLRADISVHADAPMLLSASFNTDQTRAFCGRPDSASLAQRGPATPDHIIRTKQFPMVGRDTAAFADAYRAYFDRNAERHAQANANGPAQRHLVMLDPAPRVVLDDQLGMLVAGRRWSDCVAAADIYRHTIWVIDASESLGGYVPLGEADLFDVEYWSLEQAKLTRGGTAALPLTGQVAAVTGAASGIGRASAAALNQLGAAVVGIDIAPPPAEGAHPYGTPSLHCVADATDAEAMSATLADAVCAFGGIDILVVCAGSFGPSTALAELAADDFKATINVNTTSVMATLGAAHPYLRHAPTGGRVVLVGSKNVPAPGRAAAAYSASKAAATQLARVAALEWADDGISVNTVHPDAVFDTALWSDELVAQRASAYDMTAEEYKKRNLLGREVTSATVGDLVATMCLSSFSRTTGAQIPVDGGSDRTL